ncbi:MAG: hypothetical protein Tsb0020_53390 [Haliangiales bacterium]
MASEGLAPGPEKPATAPEALSPGHPGYLMASEGLSPGPENPAAAPEVSRHNRAGGWDPGALRELPPLPRTRRDAEAAAPGLWFTEAQHTAVAALAVDIATRNGFARDTGWPRTGRLVGHEDLTPVSRHNRANGWDPGALRDKPRFSWALLYQASGQILASS